MRFVLWDLFTDFFIMFYSYILVFGLLFYMIKPIRVFCFKAVGNFLNYIVLSFIFLKILELVLNFLF